MSQQETRRTPTNRLALCASAAIGFAALLAAAAPPPPLPVLPSAAHPIKVCSVQPVILDHSYPTDFRSEHSQVTGGWLLVIEADKDILTPRALAEPLLLANGPHWVESVEWFNHGYTTGRRVCFVPAPVNEQGKLARDVDGLRLWFGSPRLPESVDAAALEQERALADAASIASTPVKRVDASARLADREALVAAARALVAREAPDEVQGK